MKWKYIFHVIIIFALKHSIKKYILPLLNILLTICVNGWSCENTFGKQFKCFYDYHCRKQLLDNDIKW